MALNRKNIEDLILYSVQNQVTILIKRRYKTTSKPLNPFLGIYQNQHSVYFINVLVLKPMVHEIQTKAA